MTPTSRTILVTGTRFAQGPVAATRGCRWLGLAEAFGFAYDRSPGKAGPATARGPNPAADTGNEAHGHRSEARRDGTRTIPDPGTRRRRDVARSRRDAASAHGGGGRPRRRGRHPPGPVHGPAVPPGPAGGAPARPERPDRVQLRRDRQGARAPRHALAGRLRARRDRRPARALRGPWPAAVSFTDRTPDEADFVVPGYPTGRAFFDDYVGQNREHAEIRPGGAYGSLEEQGAGQGSRCSTSARSARAATCWSSSGPCSTGSTAGCRRSSSAARGISARCARSFATTPASGRRSSTWPSSGASTRRRSAPWAMT